MRASLLIKHNIDTLLRERRQHRKDLAQWCRRSESWISKIFKHPNREIPLKYLDRIADFFGLAAYQLFQPGISQLSERRVQDERRSGRDRRQSHAQRVALDLAKEIARHRRRRTPSDMGMRDENAEVSSAAKIETLVTQFADSIDAALDGVANAGHQTPVVGPSQPRARRRRRAAGGHDHPADKK